MIPLANIATAVNNAKLYLIEKTKALRIALETNSKDCKVEDLAYMTKLIKALTYDIARNFSDDCTENLYKQLVVRLDGYNEPYALDNTVVIPSGTVVFYIGANAQWGLLIGNIYDQEDLNARFDAKADVPDGFTHAVDINYDSEENKIVLKAQSGTALRWKIGNQSWIIASPEDFPFIPASNNMFRKDRIILSPNIIEYLLGVEDAANPLPPNVPAGSVSFTVIDVYGNQVNTNEPQPPVDIAAPSWRVYGNVPFGRFLPGQDVPANTSVFAQIKDAFQNVLPPNYLQPLVTLGTTPSTANLQVGQALTISLNLVFDQRNAGAEISRSITKNGNPISGVSDNIIVSTTPVVYQGSVNYGQGDVIANEAGSLDPRGRIEAGSKSSSPISYSGNYPYFYLKSTSPITAADMVSAIQNGQATQVLASSSGTLVIPYAPNGHYFAVAYVATSPSKTRWYVTDLSQGPIPGGVFGDETILPVNSQDKDLELNHLWQNINFKIMVTPLLTNPGAANIQLRNS